MGRLGWVVGLGADSGRGKGGVDLELSQTLGSQQTCFVPRAMTEDLWGGGGAGVRSVLTVSFGAGMCWAPTRAQSGVAAAHMIISESVSVALWEGSGESGFVGFAVVMIQGTARYAAYCALVQQTLGACQTTLKDTTFQ